MRNLIINRVQYSVTTVTGKKFGADINFNQGLNIIYGPNSVGKSSLITGIIYCLGAEKGLGIFQNKQNPFKPEFYDKIQGEKIKTSFVKLEISNKNEIVTLLRSVINKTDVVGLKYCTIAELDTTTEIRYLIASGEGVFGTEGLQTFLFDYLNWNIVDVPTYDAELSKLYFENIISLFFVEQRMGWSQIQARQVMRYGIREVRKVVFEYIMGLDKFEAHLKEIERKELQEKIFKLKRELKEKEENIMVLINGSIENDTLYISRRDIGKTAITDALKTLSDLYSLNLKELEILTASTETADGTENILRRNLRILTHQIKKTTDKVGLILQEISSYENYLDRINVNKIKNKQLKKIEGITQDLNISTCPICESDLPSNEIGECKLCHQAIKRKISTPDENLEFLEDEKSSFEKILSIKRVELRKARYKLEELKSREKTITENIDHQIKTYIGPQLNVYRQRVIELDILFKDIELLKRTQEKWKILSPIKHSIAQLEKEENTLKVQIKEYQQSSDDTKTLNKLRDFFYANVRQLRLLKGNNNLIPSIKIDEKDSYTPYLEDYDLYNISSSSDNVRIILSYYLALLQTTIALYNSKIKFPSLLILDEPKQQNLDNQDINTFIEILEHLPKDSCQILLTTFSEQKRDKAAFKKYIIHEMLNEEDYLLKEIVK